jgi:DNA-binding transcriptional regulator YiaG
MPNLANLFNEQIRKLARREIRKQTSTLRRLTAQYRRDIAWLKRQLQDQAKRMSFLERQEKRRVATQPAVAKFEGIRFRADGLRSHRRKLGLSAEDYGRLVGTSALSIYHWESGKVRPRNQQLNKLVQIRGLGKREAMKRLEMLK